MNEIPFRERVNLARRTGGDGIVDKPHIAWRWAPGGVCRCRLLSVWRRPSDWRVISESARISERESIQRRGLTEDDLRAHKAGEMYIIDRRKLKGFDQALPLAFADWDKGIRFEVFCDHRRSPVIGTGEMLGQDCLRYEVTHRQVTRDVVAVPGQTL